MQIVKAFFLIVKRQNKSLIIYLAVFACLLVFFAKSGRQQQEAIFESSSLNMIVQDYDQTPLSKSLFAYLSEKHEVKNKNFTEEELADELYYENVDYVLTIPTGFEQSLADGSTTDILENRKRPGSTSGYFADAQIQQYLSILSAYLTAGYTPTETASFAGKAAAKEAETTFLSSNQKKIDKTLYYAFCYMPYILICLLTVGLGMILITFQKDDIDTRIQCSSLPSLHRNLQLGLGSIVFSLVCWGCLLFVSSAVTHINCFSVQWLLCLLNSFVFLLVAISITVLVGFLVHSDAVLNMVANVVGLGLSFLGGVYVPLELMSPSVVFFSRFIPSYWYIIALNRINEYTGKPSQLTSVLSCVGIELLFAVAIFCAGLVASQQRKRG